MPLHSLAALILSIFSQAVKPYWRLILSIFFFFLWIISFSKWYIIMSTKQNLCRYVIFSQIAVLSPILSTKGLSTTALDKVCHMSQFNRWEADYCFIDSCSDDNISINRKFRIGLWFGVRHSRRRRGGRGGGKNLGKNGSKFCQFFFFFARQLFLPG